MGRPVAPRGMRTRELLNYSFRLADPRMRMIKLPERAWSQALAVGELCWHLSASDDVAFISYYAREWASFSDDQHSIAESCYGKKIFGGEVRRSQWQNVRDLLERDPASRRAVLVVGEPIRESLEFRDVACITTIQFLIRDNQLHCSTSMRSNDVMWGLGYDVFFATMLQERMALELSVPMGSYHHFSASTHIYERHFAKAEVIMAAESADKFRMPMMERLDALPDFLRSEWALRNNQPNAETLVNELPRYWKELATPLQRFRTEHRRNS